MDGCVYRLYEFVDVYFRELWSEGFIVSICEEGIRLQLSRSLAARPIIVERHLIAPFRSRTPAEFLPVEMRVIYVDLEQLLQQQLASRDYEQSESAFLQFFAGVVPYYAYSLNEAVLDSLVYTSLQELLKLAIRRHFTPETRSMRLVWDRLVVVLNKMIQDERLSATRRWELFMSYVMLLAVADNPLPWIKSFESTRACLLSEVKPERREKVLLFDLFAAYLRYCVGTLRVEEGFDTVLQILKIRIFYFRSVSRWTEVEQVVRTALEDLAFLADANACTPVKKKIVAGLCDSPYQFDGSTLLQYHLLNEEVARSLLATQQAGSLQRRGMALSFLIRYFPLVPWHRLVEKRLRKDASFMSLVDVPADASVLEKPAKTMSRLPSRESVLFCEMYRLDLSMPLQNLRLFLCFRRHALMLLIIRLHCMGLPAVLWQIVLDEFLYPIA